MAHHRHPLPAGGLFAAELLKLRTGRTAVRLLAAEVTLVALAVTGVVLSSEYTDVELGTRDGVLVVFQHAGLATVVALLLGVMAVAGEHRSGTVVDTYLSVPRRYPVIVVKTVVYAGAGLVAGLLSAGTALLTTAAWMAVRDVGFDASSTLVLRCLLGMVAWNVLYAAIGVGLGTLIRSPAAATTVAVLWIMIVEGAVTGLSAEVGRWFPATAASALGYSPVTGLLPQATAGAVLLGYATVLAVVACHTASRRDVP